MSTGNLNKLCRAIVISCAAAFMTDGLVPPALAVGTSDVSFELDRDALDATPPAVPGLPQDWETVLHSGYAGPGTPTVSEAPFPSVTNFPGVLADPGRASGATNSEDATIYTGGGSKDVNDVSQWKYTSGSIPAKDDITHAYAVAYQVDHDSNPATPDHLIVYFGADRFANNGDSQIGFWFFQQDVRPGPGGKFINGVGGPGATHTEGDLLILADFTQGGAIGTIKAYRWHNNALDTANPITGAECNGGNDVCALINENLAGTPAPWPYTPKFGTTGTFPAGSFFEGGIDVTAVFATFGANAPCFASFLAETRSSQSPTAQLKDFVLGSFPLCGVGIVKNCNPDSTDDTNLKGGATFNPDAALPIHYVFKAKVENTGSGTLHDVSIKEEQIFSDADPGNCSLTKVGTTDITDIPLIVNKDTAPIYHAIPGLEPAGLGAGQSVYLTIECDSKVRELINIINVAAKTTAGAADFNVGPEQDSVSPAEACNVEVPTGVRIGKSCTDLNVLNGVTPEVCVEITVTNTSGQDLKITTLTDTHPGSDPTAMFNLFKTANGGSDTLQQTGKTDSNGNFLDRATFNHCYQPTSGSGGPDPGNVYYPDTAHVEGVGLFDGATTEDTKGATCFLCPPIVRP